MAMSNHPRETGTNTPTGSTGSEDNHRSTAVFEEWEPGYVPEAPVDPLIKDGSTKRSKQRRSLRRALPKMLLVLRKNWIAALIVFVGVTALLWAFTKDFRKDPEPETWETVPTAATRQMWHLSAERILTKEAVKTGPALPDIPETPALRREKAEVVRSMLLVEAGRVEEALAEAEHAAATRPLDAAAAHRAGVVAKAAGDLAKAHGYFQKAFDLDPFAQGSILNLAQAEFDARNYEKAGRLFATFRQKDPKQSVAAFRQVICALLTKKKLAVEKGVLEPNTVSGLYARAAVATDAGDLDLARDLVAAARDRNHPDAWRYEADLRLLGYSD